MLLHRFVEDAMKTLAISTLLALGLAAPAFAQEPPAPTPAVTPAPAETAFEPLHELDSLSVLTDEAIAPLDRIRMLRKCGGPPPKPFPVASAPKSEPAVVAESTTPSQATGG
jgi:hypothetical protein